MVRIDILHVLQQLDHVIDVDPVGGLFVGLGNLIDPSCVCWSDYDVDQCSFEIGHVHIFAIRPLHLKNSRSASVFPTEEQILCSDVFE